MARHPAGPADAVLSVTDRLVTVGPREAVLRPPSLVVGVGAVRGAPLGEVYGLVTDALRDAGLSPLSVAELATVDAKAREPGVVGAARLLGVRLVSYPADRLAEVSARVPHPSDAARTAVGTPSVAEAAALADGGELLVPKRKSAPEGRPAGVTCAVVRRAPRGRIAVVGAGADAQVQPVPWEVTERRVRAAARTHDAVVAPADAGRDGARPDVSSRLTTLGRVDRASVDMMTVVTVGNTATSEIASRAETPCGHRWQS